MGKSRNYRKARLYAVWSTMKQRCYDVNATGYGRYGGRGITVCAEWKDSFQAFHDWAVKTGYDETAPRHACTLDRIDNEKGYSPDNCRWANAKTQNNNNRQNHLITYQGETKTLTQWAEIIGVIPDTVNHRAQRNLSVEEILCPSTSKVQTLRSRLKAAGREV